MIELIEEKVVADHATIKISVTNQIYDHSNFEFRLVLAHGRILTMANSVPKLDDDDSERLEYLILKNSHELLKIPFTFN